MGLPVNGETGPRNPGGGGMGLPVMGDNAPRFGGAGLPGRTGRGLELAPWGEVGRAWPGLVDRRPCLASRRALTRTG